MILERPMPLAPVLRELSRGRSRRQWTAPQEPMPATLKAPARAEHREQGVPTTRLNPQRSRVAIRAVVPFREQVEEKNRSEDGAEDKKTRR